MSEDLIDLHTHSTFSDGSNTPQQLIELACEYRASAIALTDHDTIDGLRQAQIAADRAGIELVNGIEISAEYSPGTMHILGYFVNPASERLVAQLERLKTARERRNPRIAEKLSQLGIDISYDEVERVAGSDVVGRPHFARLMLEKRYVSSIQEAFDRYLAKGAPAYVEKERLEPPAAIQMIHDAGGVAVLAHPYQLKCGETSRFEAVLETLVEAGLDGIEAIYSRHTPAQRNSYGEIAKARGLLVTGGSDYHGTYKPDLNIVVGKGDLQVPSSLLEEVRSRCRSRQNSIS